MLNTMCRVKFLRIGRCMYNYNGVLQICAGFVNAAVYRLKKTWEKISKQVRAMMSGVYKDVVALSL